MQPYEGLPDTYNFSRIHHDRSILMKQAPVFDTLSYSQQGAICSVTLNRPRTGNEVNPKMASELRAVALLANNDEAIRVVVLTGKGKSFSSGLWSSPKASNYPDTPLQAAATISQIHVPVIAAINGDAVGQGLELALAADIRVAANGAHFGLPHLRKGLLPWDGGTQRLPRLIGRSKALELLLTGENIDAHEAERIGLINRVEDLDNLNNVVDEIAIQIAGAAPIATRYIKEAVTEGVDLSLDHGLRLEADLSILLHTTKDRSEGIHSFLERRAARFSGK